MLNLFKFIFLFSNFLSKCSSANQTPASKVISTKTFMCWPNATIPFYINPDHFDREQMLAIMTSLSMFAFKTCLKFAPVLSAPDENQHVMVFVNPEGIRRCKIDTHGHSTYHPHLVLLGYECLQSPEIDMIIMRALGFPFEHNRLSREVYIDVLIENIEPSSVGLFTKDSVLPPALRALPYDINSVMHFGERDYSKNGHRTIMFKNHNIRQNRRGLSSTDLRKIELVYGPECRNRDRQEKIELCQSYPGVARRKREIFEPPVNISLRVNRNITPPPYIETTGTTETTETTETKEPPVEPSSAEKPPETGHITESLQELGIGNEADEIIEQVYKVSGLALKHAHAKYCNATNSSIPKYEKANVKKSNVSDLIGILEVITDYASTVVYNALNNLTAFCESPGVIENYQRQCNPDRDPRCRNSYNSTRSGTVMYSMNITKSLYIQPTSHEGDENKHQNEKEKNDNQTKGSTEASTPSTAARRRKREATEPTSTPKPDPVELKEKKIQKEKKYIKEKEKEKILKDNSTKAVKAAGDAKVPAKETRRYFKERRYKVKHPEDSSAEWEASNTSLDKDKEQEKENKKHELKEKEITANKHQEKNQEKEAVINLEAPKLTDKDDIKQEFGEGLKKLKAKSDEKDEEPSKSEESKDAGGEDEEEEEGDDEEELEVEPVTKEMHIKKEIFPEKGIAIEDPKIFHSEKNDDDKRTERDKDLVILKEIGIDQSVEIETVVANKKPNTIPKDKEILDLEEDKTKLLRKAKINTDTLKSSRKSLPRTVKLNALNKDFYNERRWPDGIVRFVIKKYKNYDLDDLRNRLAEVNSILIKETCVRLHEVDEQEADGYEDSIILDTSPDYVTGRVGGKQIFGCVELFRGGQHRQHTAMMVMAMLGFYFEVSRHDRDTYIRVHNRHVRPDKLHHFEKIRDEATLDLPYDYKSATHPAWQFWRKIGKTGISTVATYKDRDPDGSIMRSLGQNERLLSEIDIIKINSVYGIDCFQNTKMAKRLKRRPRRRPRQ